MVFVTLFGTSCKKNKPNAEEKLGTIEEEMTGPIDEKDMGDIKSDYKTAVVESDYDDPKTFEFVLKNMIDKDKINILLITKKPLDKELSTYNIDYIGEGTIPKKILIPKPLIKEETVTKEDFDKANNDVVSNLLKDINSPENTIYNREDIDTRLFYPSAHETDFSDFFMKNDWKESFIQFMSMKGDNKEYLGTDKYEAAYKILENGDRAYFITPRHGFEYNEKLYLETVKSLSKIINEPFEKVGEVNLSIPCINVDKYVFKTEDIPFPPQSQVEDYRNISFNKPFIIAICKGTNQGQMLKGAILVKNLEAENPNLD